MCYQVVGNMLERSTPSHHACDIKWPSKARKFEHEHPPAQDAQEEGRELENPSVLLFGMSGVFWYGLVSVAATA